MNGKGISNARCSAIVGVFIMLGLGVLGLGMLAGCPAQSAHTASAPAPVAQAAGFHGSLYGGRQPIVGARIVAYASGATVGAAPAVIGSDTTDANGRFSIPGFNPAPTAGQMIYVVASGGTAVTGGSANAAIRLMTVAGVQGNLLAPVVGTVNINELSTVAATAALQHYIQFGACPAGVSGSDCVLIPGAAGLAKAAAQANNLVDVTTGKATKFMSGPTGGEPYYPEEWKKLNSLGDILAGCVNGTGATAAACTTLFSLATSGTTTLTPSDTLEAAFNIASDPVVNARVKPLFTLVPQNPIYAPVLGSTELAAGSYWTLAGQTFVFVAEQGENGIVSYRLTAAGNLVRTVFAFGYNAAANQVDALAPGPRGRFLYAADYNDPPGTQGSVSGFAINPADGVLFGTGTPTSTAGENVTSVTVDALGRFVYAANNATNGGVSGWTLDPVTGDLTPISGSPFFTNLEELSSVVTDTTGSDLVAVDFDGNEVIDIPINQSTGILADAGSSGVALSPWGTVVAPGDFLYVSQPSHSEVSSWALGNGNNSMFSPVTGGADQGACGGGIDPHNCVATGVGPRGMAVGRIHGSNSNYLFVANSGSNNISLFSLNSSGQPSVMNTATAGASPLAITSDPAGNYAWAANNGNATLTAYTLDSATGLTRRSDLPKTTPAGPNLTRVALDSNGYAYAAVSHTDPTTFATTGAISAYTVSGSNGSLAAITSGTVPPVACGNSVRDPQNCQAAVNTNLAGFELTPDGQYLYVAYFVFDYSSFQEHSEIAAWKVNADGTLSPITAGTTAPGSCVGITPDNANCYAAGAEPLMEVSPDGKFLYGVNFGGDDISVWKINSDGTLTANGAAQGAGQCQSTQIPIPNLPANCYPAGPAPGPLNLQNAGYAYAINSGNPPSVSGPSTVSAWTLDATTGAPTPIAGAACGNPTGETDPDNCVYAGAGAGSVTLAPSHAFAYVANPYGNNVSAYTINAATGALLPLATGGAGDCFTPSVTHDPANCFAAGIFPYGVTVVDEGANSYAYAVNGGGSDISAWKIGSGGALIPVTGHACGTAATADPDNCVATGHGAAGVAVSSAANGDGYAYVLETSEGTIAEYSIGSDGKLTPIGSPVFAGPSPASMVFNADGSHVYVANTGQNDIVVFSRSGGALTPLATATAIPVGKLPSALAVTP